MTEEAVAAIRNGEPVILPTDTVYGLVVAPFREEPARRLSELKGRDVSQPISLMVPELHMLFELVPELRGRAELIAKALLPTPGVDGPGVPAASSAPYAYQVVPPRVPV